jgi:hypothetical protein
VVVSGLFACRRKRVKLGLARCHQRSNPATNKALARVNRL